MGKAFGPEIEYCWDKAWVFSFNNPREEVESGDEIKGVDPETQAPTLTITQEIKTYYDHQIIFYMEMQTAEKKKVELIEYTILLATTESQLTFFEKSKLITAPTTLQTIKDFLIQIKEQTTGYAFAPVDDLT